MRKQSDDTGDVVVLHTARRGPRSSRRIVDDMTPRPTYPRPRVYSVPKDFVDRLVVNVLGRLRRADASRSSFTFSNTDVGSVDRRLIRKTLRELFAGRVHKVCVHRAQKILYIDIVEIDETLGDQLASLQIPSAVRGTLDGVRDHGAHHWLDRNPPEPPIVHGEAMSSETWNARYVDEVLLPLSFVLKCMTLSLSLVAAVMIGYYIAKSDERHRNGLRYRECDAKGYSQYGSCEPSPFDKP